MDKTVGEVSRATGLTVRTLHHYDEIDLVVPSGRTSAGYRLYSDDDVQRLHQVLTYRELGFSLDQVALLLSDETPDAVLHLLRQHEAVVEQIAHLQRVQAMIETMIEATMVDVKLTPEETFEVFGGSDPNEHQVEARERWGESDEFAESSRRTSRYNKQDWVQIRSESDTIEAAWTALLRSGVPSDEPKSVALAERHRRHIDQWFYPCSPDIHRSLADMYVSDARFAAYYDSREPGLAKYVHDAIWANGA